MTEETWTLRGLSSVGRAPALQAGGQGFDPPSLHPSGKDQSEMAGLFLFTYPPKASRSQISLRNVIYLRSMALSSRIAAGATVGAFSLLALTGCTINIGTAGNNSGMMGGMMGNNSNSSKYSGADIMFAQMMIPHHQQAVDMGTLAETRALDPAVKALAAKIKSEQAPEIQQMKGWLKAANAPATMDHEMGMGGMLSDAEMTALENASGAEFDRLYLTGMIGHHQGAIHMAQMVIDSNNGEVRALANSIVTSQTAQITYMQSLLKKLK